MNKIFTSSPSVYIKDVLMLNENYTFAQHNAFYNYTPSNMINLMMTAGKDYYLVLSSNSAQTASLTSEAVPDIVLNGEVPLSLTANGSYQYVEVYNSINYNNQTSFSWMHQEGISGYRFNIAKGGREIFSVDVVSLSNGLNNYNIMPQLISRGVYGDVSVSLTYIFVDNMWLELSNVANGDKLNINGKNLSVGVSCMYSRIEAGKHYISNELQFNNIRQSMSCDLYLDNDLDLGFYYAAWTPISTLDYNLYGQGHKVYNIRITVPSNPTVESYFGLFGINNATISNLHIPSLYINSFGGSHNKPLVNVGSFAGMNLNAIDNCSALGNIYVHHNNSRTGGLVGHNLGTISNSTFGSRTEAACLIQGNGDIGGIAGQNAQIITNSHIYNSRVELWVAYSNRSAGGIVGFNYGGTISYCNVYSTVIAYVGGGGIDLSSLRPCIGIVVGNISNSNLHYVGSENARVNTGSLNSSQASSCANGPWGVYGYAYNTSVK